MKLKYLLLILICIPLLACTNYKTISNTKRLNNYEYSLTKEIILNNGENKFIEENGYVYENIEKRIVKIDDKEYVTYYETNDNGSFIYTLNKNNEYIRKRIPYIMTSYINLINSDWFEYNNNKLVLSETSHTKILKLLNIHKYIADDIELESYEIGESNNVISSIDVTLILLKNKENIGKCNVKYQIYNINQIKSFQLPNIN